MSDLRLAALVASCAAMGIFMVPVGEDVLDRSPRKDPDPQPETLERYRRQYERLSNGIERAVYVSETVTFVDTPKAKGKRAKRRDRGRSR